MCSICRLGGHDGARARVQMREGRSRKGPPPYDFDDLCDELGCALRGHGIAMPAALRVWRGRPATASIAATPAQRGSDEESRSKSRAIPRPSIWRINRSTSIQNINWTWRKDWCDDSPCPTAAIQPFHSCISFSSGLIPRKTWLATMSFLWNQHCSAITQWCEIGDALARRAAGAANSSIRAPMRA